MSYLNPSKILRRDVVAKIDVVAEIIETEPFTAANLSTNLKIYLVLEVMQISLYFLC